MQTENLPNKRHKQFYVIFNTNQTKLYNPDLQKENNSNLKGDNQSTYFLNPAYKIFWLKNFSSQNRQSIF